MLRGASCKTASCPSYLSGSHVTRPHPHRTGTFTVTKVPNSRPGVVHVTIPQRGPTQGHPTYSGSTRAPKSFHRSSPCPPLTSQSVPPHSLLPPPTEPLPTPVFVRCPPFYLRLLWVFFAAAHGRRVLARFGIPNRPFTTRGAMAPIVRSPFGPQSRDETQIACNLSTAW